MKFTCFLPQHTHGLSNQGTLFVIRMGPFHGISMCWGNALRNCTYPLQKLLTEPYLILCWGNALRHCTYPLQKLLTVPYLILCWGNALRHCTYLRKTKNTISNPGCVTSPPRARIGRNLASLLVMRRFLN